MPTITEKNIHLDFPAGWQVVKYDDTFFYRRQIENQVDNVRGVDVVCQTISPDNRLLLIEIKDYRLAIVPAEKSVVKLRQTVVQKALNTLSGLYSAARVGDAELRPVVARIFQSSLIIEVILFLERPPIPAVSITTAAKFRRQNPQVAINNLLLDLTSTLHDLGLLFQLRSSSTMQLPDGWSARV